MSDPLGAALLAWFHRVRRKLPWRSPFPRDPYRVLVSEVMLQQTQVGRVVPAYGRFLARFPTLEALAAAAEDEVMQAFSGLGYYRRARALHAAVRTVVARGGWPTSRAELAHLPGLGAYTSAAVAAFCFAGDAPPVDGNVARLAARMRALPLPLGSRASLAEGESFARELFAESATPEVWEALMEFGARVCTPRSPGCSVCPWAARCAGFASGHPEAFPLPWARRAKEDHLWVAVWVERDDGRVLLRRVDDGPLFHGLWLPPLAGVGVGQRPAEVASALVRDAGFGGELRRVATVRHTITHRRIAVLPFVTATHHAAVRETPPGWAWQNPLVPAGGTSTLLGKLHAVCAAKPPRGSTARYPGGRHG